MSGSFTSLADLVQHFENPAGDPTALNYRYDATHTASGLYQITDTTWGGFGGYSSAASAPVDVQNAKFADLVSRRGLADWTCPGCNPQLTDYLAANPAAANLPITAGDTAASGSSGLFGNGQGWFGTDYGAPPAGTPAPGTPGGDTFTGSGLPGGGKAGSLPGAVANGAGALTGWISSVAGRVVYGIVGFILVIMALYIYALRTQNKG